MKECFTTHALLHSLTGLGVGLIVAALVPSLANVVIGIAVVVIGGALDYMRKS